MSVPSWEWALNVSWHYFCVLYSRTSPVACFMCAHTHTPCSSPGEALRAPGPCLTRTHIHTQTHTPRFLTRWSSQGTRTMCVSLSLSLSLSHTHTHTHTQGTRTVCAPRHFYTGAPYILSWAMGLAKCVPSGPDLAAVKRLQPWELKLRWPTWEARWSNTEVAVLSCC